MYKGRVIVTPTHVGICGSDLQKIAAGADFYTLGHEIVGTAMIDGNMRRVAVNPLIGCGECDLCRSGRSMFCESLVVVGRNFPGAFSGDCSVPLANTVIIPRKLPSETAALADPYAVILHGFSLVDKAANAGNILIIGDGVISLLNLVYLFIHGGANANYTLLCRSHDRVVPLKEWLAAWAPGSFSDRVTFTDTLPNDAVFDVALETIGRDQSQSLSQAIAHTVPRGYILNYGVYPPGTLMTLNIRELMYKEIHLVGVNSYNPEDFSKAVREISRNAQIMGTIIGDTYALKDHEAAIAAARDKIKGIAKKIIVTMEPI